MTPPRLVYTLAEAAAILRVNERTVRRWIAARELRICKRLRGRTGKLGRQIRIPASEIERLTAATA